MANHYCGAGRLEARMAQDIAEFNLARASGGTKVYVPDAYIEEMDAVDGETREATTLSPRR